MNRLVSFAFAEKPRFSASSILLYLGAFTVLFSSYGLFAAVSQSHGNGAAFAWSLIYLAALVVLVLGLYLSRQPISAGLLAFVAAAFTPVWIVTLEKLAGYWQGSHGPLETTFSGSWFLAELVTFLVCLVALLLTRFPLLGLALALSAWYTVADNSSAAFLSSGSGNHARAGLAIVIGLIMMGVAVFLDETDLRLASFWLHLVGLLSFAAGIVDVWHSSDGGWFGILVLSLLAIGVSLALDRAVYGAIGAIGLLYSLIHFADKWLTQGFHVSLGGASHGADWKPWLVYVLVGLALMGVGMLVGYSALYRGRPRSARPTAAADAAPIDAPVAEPPVDDEPPSESLSESPSQPPPAA